MKKTFNAIRVITKGNLLFRDKIILDTDERKLTYWKRNPIGIGHSEIVVYFNDIISFRLITRLELLLFCNISIETKGGKEIEANGFLIKDAKEIKQEVGF